MALSVIARTLIKGTQGAGLGALAFRVLGRSDIRLDRGVGIELRGNVRGEVRNVDKLLKEHDAVTAIALNKAARSARTATGRELAKVKGVPQKILRKRIQSFKATPRKKPIRASLWVGTSKPVTANELTGQVSLTKGGNVKVGRRVFKGAFPAQMPNGHRGIFTRKPGARHRERADGQRTELPIQEAIVQLMPEAEHISRRMAERAIAEIYPKEVKRLMELRAERWRR